VPTYSVSSWRRTAPDVVHAHKGRSAVLGAGLAAVNGAAFVRTQHFVRPASIERAGWRGRASRAMHRLLNSRLDGYVCVSQAVAEAARARRDAVGTPTAVIPSGVELPRTEEVQRFIASRSADPRSIVVSAGRLEPERRLDVLLDAVAQVRDAIPGCWFVIAGSGSAEEDLKAQARRLGIEDVVQWTGWLPEIRPLLAGSHVYVNTWPWEGFGMATAEAMGAALPVVAVNSGASPELIVSGVTGLLVPPADSGALAAAICEVLTDRERMRVMGAAGRERALAHYSMPATAESMLEFYRGLPRARGER
jgi:glycosyltransferase involved in cell wall biosynthesis